MTREESMRLAAEKIRLKKEKEQREENEFYERITTGSQWLLFKIVVVFTSLMFLITLFEFFVDGPTKKISDEACKIDKEWEYGRHTVLDVEGYMFTPTVADWVNRVENSTEMTYSPIFRTGKKLCYKLKSNSVVKDHEELRQMSVFNWFPAFQILLLIPLLTFIFKRQQAWFNFARMTSLYLIFPATIVVIFMTLL